MSHHWVADVLWATSDPADDKFGRHSGLDEFERKMDERFDELESQLSDIGAQVCARG